jgi:hypothetical protein
VEVHSREEQQEVVGKSTGGSHFHFYGVHARKADGVKRIPAVSASNALSAA